MRRHDTDAAFLPRVRHVRSSVHRPNGLAEPFFEIDSPRFCRQTCAKTILILPLPNRCASNELRLARETEMSR